MEFSRLLGLKMKILGGSTKIVDIVIYIYSRYFIYTYIYIFIHVCYYIAIYIYMTQVNSIFI